MNLEIVFTVEGLGFRALSQNPVSLVALATKL